MAKRKRLNCLNNDMRLTIAFSVSTELIISNALFIDLSFINFFILFFEFQKNYGACVKN